jgi:hypothetical protein
VETLRLNHRREWINERPSLDQIVLGIFRRVRFALAWRTEPLATIVTQM